MTTLTAISLTASPAFADVWGVVPRANLSARYDQNAQMSVGQSNGSTGAAASVGARATHYGETTDESLDSQFLFVRYPEEHALNRDEVQINGSETTHYERAGFESVATYTRDTTITSELGASGLTESNLPHEHIGVTLTPSYQLAPLWSTSASASWSNDRYSHGREVGLVDYDYASFAAQLQYSPSERTSVSVDASVGKLSVPDLQTTTNQYATNLHFDSLLSERWRLSVSGGPLRVASDVSTDNGLGYSTKLNRQSEITNIAFSASRSVVPNGRGILSKRDQLAATIGHNFSSRLSGDTTAQWIRSRDAVPLLGLQFGDVRYVAVDAALRWQATLTTAISFSVGWSRQDQDTNVVSADSYRAALSLVWQGLERGR